MYINSIDNNKNRDFNSLSFLIKKTLSQSECIKLGIAIEKILRDIILTKNSSLTNIKTKNIKGEKEKDHLFKDEVNKIIYYAEIKSNLNLDTEKSISTINKCIDIKTELQSLYNDFEVKMFLVGIRYCNIDIIPSNIRKKYNKIDSNLCGINEYFSALNIPIQFYTGNQYIIFLNYISCKMFQ